MTLVRAVFAILFTLIFSVAALAEGQRVILVLDASGSMWGQINGVAKMEIAKDVVGKVIGKWKPDDELGLVAYGHREKGSCTDIETVLEPVSLNADAYMSAVRGLSPKGKTPMTQAVRQAAEALKYTERQATVILVSDGIETCDPNPCAVAEELERLGVGLTVHTVGFGLDDKGAVEQLKCLAEKTGGISVLADNAEDLERALTKTVEAAPVPEFNLLGKVQMAEGVPLPPGYDSATWDIKQSVGGEVGQGVRTDYGASIRAAIEQPGPYFALIRVDVANILVPFTIEAGKQTLVDQSMDAGLVHFEAMLDEATPSTDGGTTWELSDKNGQWITTKYGPKASFFANAGEYRMKLSLGTAQVEGPVVFTAGKIGDQVMTLGGGVIRVKTVFAPGGPEVLDGAAIELQEGTKGLDGKYKWITTTYGPQVEFKVGAGKYHIVATQDYATGSADVEVKAGQGSDVEVSVNGGFLAATADPGATIEVYDGKPDISGKRKWLGTEYNGQFNKAFNAGSYRVVAKKPDGSVIDEKDVSVTAGQRLEVALP
jgi:Ca-activated chloride channel family protein